MAVGKKNWCLFSCVGSTVRLKEVGWRIGSFKEGEGGDNGEVVVGLIQCLQNMYYIQILVIGS